MNIPDKVVQNSKLGNSAKYLYGLILENLEDGICLKDNAFFSASLGGVTERTIRNYLSELKKEGLIASISYGKVKNAIFILDKNDIVESEKIKTSSDLIKNVSLLEKFFSNSAAIKSSAAFLCAVFSPIK